MINVNTNKTKLKKSFPEVVNNQRQRKKSFRPISSTVSPINSLNKYMHLTPRMSDENKEFSTIFSSKMKISSISSNKPKFLTRVNSSKISLINEKKEQRYKIIKDNNNDTDSNYLYETSKIILTNNKTSKNNISNYKNSFRKSFNCNTILTFNNRHINRLLSEKRFNFYPKYFSNDINSGNNFNQLDYNIVNIVYSKLKNTEDYNNNNYDISKSNSSIFPKEQKNKNKLKININEIHKKFEKLKINNRSGGSLKNINELRLTSLKNKSINSLNFILSRNINTNISISTKNNYGLFFPSKIF